MNELELARAARDRLAAERRRCWDQDPGNHHIMHVWSSAMDYQRAFQEWRAADERVRALEAQYQKKGGF